MSVAGKLMGTENSEGPLKRRGFLKDITQDFMTSFALTLPMGSSYDQDKNWFTYGDMYPYSNEKTDFEVYICEDDFIPEHVNFYLKDYKKKLTDDYIQDWTEQANNYLKYLSGEQFKLDLKKIERVKTDYWHDKKDGIPKADRKSFKMTIHPTAVIGGYYGKNGFIWANPFHLQLDVGKEKTFDSLPIHEIFHGFFGGNHSDSPNSIMNSSVSVIGLTEREAKHLGWPVVKTIDVHPLRYAIVFDVDGTKKLEFYRD